MDKARCVSAELLPSGAAVIQRAVDANLYAAIGRAVEGIGHSFARALGRNRERADGNESVGETMEPAAIVVLVITAAFLPFCIRIERHSRSRERAQNSSRSPDDHPHATEDRRPE